MDSTAWRAASRLPFCPIRAAGSLSRPSQASSTGARLAGHAMTWRHARPPHPLGGTLRPPWQRRFSDSEAVTRKHHHCHAHWAKRLVPPLARWAKQWARPSRELEVGSKAVDQAHCCFTASVTAGRFAVSPLGLAVKRRVPPTLHGASEASRSTAPTAACPTPPQTPTQRRRACICSSHMHIHM